MNAGYSCRARTTHSSGVSLIVTRRCRDIGGWLLPTAILVVLPKCPACLAMYIAMGTGLGISIVTATYVHVVLVFLCVASLVYVTGKRVGKGGSRCEANTHNSQHC